VTDARDFAEFYSAHFAALTAQLYYHTGDLAEAQDVVQDAFCRAYDRWSVVSGYDEPVAWVRRVAWNLATSRWRRLRRGVELAVREHARTDLPGPGPDRVLLAGALRTLSARHRQAVILHYLEDLPVEEVARLMGVAEGTVKSWLHRARAALARQLCGTELEFEGAEHV
jgi:RNA polymerase sigma-70 factor (ECF subfamily)